MSCYLIVWVYVVFFQFIFTFSRPTYLRRLLESQWDKTWQIVGVRQLLKSHGLISPWTSKDYMGKLDQAKRTSTLWNQQAKRPRRSFKLIKSPQVDLGKPFVDWYMHNICLPILPLSIPVSVSGDDQIQCIFKIPLPYPPTNHRQR